MTITVTPPTFRPGSNSDDDEYDLVIPRLVLFILMPLFIAILLIIGISIMCLLYFRRCKLNNMKYCLQTAESARSGNNTMEQARLTQGTFQNTYAESLFTTTGQSSPIIPQSQSLPPVPWTQSPVPPHPPMPVSQW